jgi:hypothetical protein
VQEESLRTFKHFVGARVKLRRGAGDSYVVSVLLCGDKARERNAASARRYAEVTVTKAARTAR